MPPFERRLKRLEGRFLPPTPPGPPWDAEERVLLEGLAACLDVAPEALPAWPGWEPCHGLWPLLLHLRGLLQQVAAVLEAFAHEHALAPGTVAGDERWCAMARAQVDQQSHGGYRFYWTI